MKMSEQDERVFVPQNITQQMEYAQMKEAQKRALKGNAAVRAVEELMGRELDRNEKKLVIAEGYSPNLYLDSKDIITRGVGQTAEYLDKSFDEVLDAKDKQLRTYLPDYDLYTDRLKDALFSNNYRGSLGQSKNTRELINQGKFKEAAYEFLDNDEYRNPETSQGIKNRFEETHKALLEQAELGLEIPTPAGYGNVTDQLMSPIDSGLMASAGAAALDGFSQIGDKFVSMYDDSMNWLDNLNEKPEATAPSTHTVVKGDNPWDIAKKYKINVDELAALNPDKSKEIIGGRIYGGDKLNVRYSSVDD